MPRVTAIKTAFEKIKEDPDMAEARLYDILRELYKRGFKRGFRSKDKTDPAQGSLDIE